MELRLDSRQVGKDIGVVVFEIVEHSRAGEVVDELAAFVEKSRVVLVRFDDKQARFAGGGRSTRRHAKVKRHTADQETGSQARIFENPRKHRAGCRLAVCTGDRKHPLPAQQLFPNPLRAGHKTCAGVENRFHQWVAARNDIADHIKIGLDSELARVETFDQVDAR